MTTPELGGDLRNLIDARLDQIERVLLRVDVSYSERRHIVGEVESQIFELLARRSESPSREDVQAVLDSLDPAEAYIPEELRGRFAAAAPIVETLVKRPSGPRVSRLAIASAVLGFAFLVVGLFALFEHANTHEVFVIFGAGLFAMTACGSVAFARILLSGGRLTGLPIALFATALFPMAFSIVASMLIIFSIEILPPLTIFAMVIFLNFLAVRRLWKWTNEHQTQLTDSLRNTLHRANLSGSDVRAV